MSSATTHRKAQPAVPASLDNPLAGSARPAESPGAAAPAGAESEYDRVIRHGEELLAKPRALGGPARVLQQHAKGRMTVLERLQVLTDREPNILFQNWGQELDGASILTAVANIGGRDVAVYGHDFTQRAGSMDATNGAKLAKLLYLAADQGIPVIGMNDSAGAFVPAGVGGLARLGVRDGRISRG